MKISTVSEMRALDQTAVDQFGIREELLMENAGLAVYRVINDNLGVCGKRFLIFCGIGNNGGDGFVVARQLHANGAAVRVFILGEADKFKGAARMNLDLAKGLPIDIESVDQNLSLSSVLSGCDIVVDAIFGTGLTREVKGVYARVIDAMNTSGKPLVSVDIPSGVHGDDGRVMGTAVQADYTVTFGLPKIGSLLYPGYANCGQLILTHISFPPAMTASDSLKRCFNTPIALPPRNPDGHKGSFGDALFIAGASSYFGAPCFAALSFLKAGGGYSRLAAPQSMTPFLAARGSEIVFAPMVETAWGSIALDNRPVLLKLCEKVDIVAIGPGLSLDSETQGLVRELTLAVEKPLIIDGDGITALGRKPDVLRQRKAETVITPHPGEMSRLTGLSTADIAADRVAVVQDFARAFDTITVLKGAHTLIGTPDQRVYVNMTGNSGMASAGSGDVLTGTIAAMFGLGLSMEGAARNGVFVHGLAGDLAAADIGPDGISARDILEAVPGAVQQLRQGPMEDLIRLYGGIPII